MKTNVVLMDGRKVTREGISILLQTNGDIDVVGEVDDDAVSAIKVANALGAQVAVMLVGNFTPQAAERVRALSAGVKGLRVIVLLLHLDGTVLRRALEAGAAGCLSKDCASAELVAAIRAVRCGGTYLSPRATDEVVNRYVLNRGSGGRVAPALSAREQEVLQRIANGETTKEIAARFGVGVKSVETYRRRLMEKLGIHTVAGLTKYAVRQGLSSLEPSTQA